MLVLRAMIKEHEEMRKDRDDLSALFDGLEIKYNLEDLIGSINEGSIRKFQLIRGLEDSL